MISGIRAARVGRLRFVRSSRGASSTRWPLLVAAVAVVAIVLGAGLATNWFGLTSVGAATGNGGGTGPPGPNPNPYNETIRGLIGGIVYQGASSGYFPALDDKQLCGPCPAMPFRDANFTPPYAAYLFYFNVTNTGSAIETLANYTVATGGTNPTLFHLQGVYCCSPSYTEPTTMIQFTKDTTYRLAVYVYAAPPLPDVGVLGFELYFNATSP